MIVCFYRPSPEVTWLKNFRELVADGKRILLENYKLTIKDVTLDDKGMYSCKINNEVSQILINLDVLG